MKASKAFVVITLVTAGLFAFNASAQMSKVMAAPMYYYDAGFQWLLPGDAPSSVPLEGLKTAHGAWLTFLKFQDGSLPQKPEVFTLMEGAVVTWTGPQSCSYELRLQSDPPVIIMTKTSAFCGLRLGETALFRVLAM